MNGLISDMIDTLESLALSGEDSESLTIVRNAPCSDDQLRQYEESTGIRISGELRDLLECSNGMTFFGLECMSLGQLHYHEEAGLIAFHNWGNGDFDCVSVGSTRHAVGAVVFMNHSPERTITIVDSLSNWLKKVVQELQNEGALLHPDDYRNRQIRGLYEHVRDSLKGTDCELNG